MGRLGEPQALAVPSTPTLCPCEPVLRWGLPMAPAPTGLSSSATAALGSLPSAFTPLSDLWLLAPVPGNTPAPGDTDPAPGRDVPQVKTLHPGTPAPPLFAGVPAAQGPAETSPRTLSATQPGCRGADPCLTHVTTVIGDVTATGGQRLVGAAQQITTHSGAVALRDERRQGGSAGGAERRPPAGPCGGSGSWAGGQAGKGVTRRASG